MDETPTGFMVHLALKDPSSGKIITKKFSLVYTPQKKEKLQLTPTMMQGVIRHLLSKVPLEEIQSTHASRGMSSLVNHFVKKIGKRKIYEQLRSQFTKKGETPQEYPLSASEERKKQQRELAATRRAENRIAPEIKKAVVPVATSVEEDEGKKNGKKKNSVQRNFESTLEKTRIELKTRLATSLPEKSIFVPESTGVTYGIIGKSFSGKTHFWVHELNKLTKEELLAYNAILFFTESTSAEPLAALKKTVKKKMITFDRFCPTILAILKRINDETQNQFKFLVILDDILELRNMLVMKMILTLRNSNISTVISIQYEKLIAPAQRSSLHNLYIFNLRTESWEYMLKGYLLGNFKELIPALSERENIGKRRLTPAAIAEILRETMNDYICGYDQRRDVLKIYYKKKEGKRRKGDKKKRKEVSDDEDEDDKSSAGDVV